MLSGKLRPFCLDLNELKIMHSNNQFCDLYQAMPVLFTPHPLSQVYFCFMLDSICHAMLLAAISFVFLPWDITKIIATGVR